MLRIFIIPLANVQIANETWKIMSYFLPQFLATGIKPQNLINKVNTLLTICS